jgi:hypothetical protein
LSSRRSFARLLAPLLLLVMVTSACAKDVDEPDGAAPEATTSSTAAAAEPTYPLTGLTSDDEARRTRPALVVKIDNNEGARPPVGINQADVVYEEEIEAGFTRFAAIFQSQDADPVGPIRSARISDVELLANLNRPLLAWSGANSVTASAIRSADLVDVGFDAETDEYERATNRPAPSNLFATTTGLYTHVGEAGFAPSLFQYAQDASTAESTTTTEPGAVPSTTVAAPGAPTPVAGGRVAFRSRDIVYVWDEGRAGWIRFQDGTPYADDKNELVAPANVVFLYIDYLCCPTVPGTPEAQTVGEGDAAVFTDGHFIDAHWSRPSPTDVWNLTDKATGQPILLTPGRTWVELANPGTGSFVEQAEADELVALAAQPITQDLGTPEF